MNRITGPSGTGLKISATIVLALIGLAFALPMLWVVLASLDAHPTLAVQAPSVTLSNYEKVLTPQLAFTPLLNSLLLAGGSALVAVTVAVLAGYPLSRFKSRFNRPFLYAILFGTCLPITAMMVPVYSLFVTLNLVDSLPATLFFMSATSLPMAIWMSKNFIDSVPVSLEEAARTDGASGLKTLISIVVPLMRPGIAVVFIFVFVQAWGNFFVPFILLLSPQKQPASVSIYTFFGEYGAVAYGQLAAYSVIYAAPVLILYVIVSRALGGASLLTGAVKG